MGLTRFPHGILATPNLGSSEGSDYTRLVQLWESDNIWYVDGDEGSASNDGTTPDQSVALISTAVGLASRCGTIYVKPRTTVASAQSYYVDTIDIPLTKPQLSIIGAGSTGSRSGVQVKPSSVGDHLITVKAGGLTLENMRLTLTGGTASAGKSIVQAVSETGVAQPDGLTIRHCRFEGDKTAPFITSSSSSGICSSIGLGTVNYCTIEDNVFYSCNGGIAAQLSTAAYHNLLITRNIFSGAPANRCCDIFLTHGTTGGVLITHNIFADGLPTKSAHASTGNKFIKIVDAGTGLLGWNAFATTADGEVCKAAGSECIIPTTYFTAGNVYEGAASEGDGFCRRT